MNHPFYPLSTLLLILSFGCERPNFPDRYIDQDKISLVCVEKNGKYGFIDEFGDEIIPCIYDHPSSFSEGWAALKKGRKWAYYDVRGHQVLDLKRRFTYCGRFNDGVAMVSTLPTKNVPPNHMSYWEDICAELQFINRKGEVLFKIDNVWEIACHKTTRNGFSDGLLKVTYKDTNRNEIRIGYLNKQGLLEIPFDYRGEPNTDEIFFEGLAGIGLRSNPTDNEKSIIKYGYINKKGEWQIPPVYSYVYPFFNGVAIIADLQPNSRNQMRFFMIDKLGNRIFSEDVQTFARMQRDNLVAIFKYDTTAIGTVKIKSKRWAMAKIDGTILTDFKYAELHPGKTADDLWKARLPGKEKMYGFVNDQDSLVIPFQYYGVNQYFEDGLAIVTTDKKPNKRAVIDTKGNLVTKPLSEVNYQISGVILTVSEEEGIVYHNRAGEIIDFGEYQIAGGFQYLPLPAE